MNEDVGVHFLSSPILLLNSFENIVLMTLLTNRSDSALPILRQLGTQGGAAAMLKGGDLSMVKVWAGLEARKFLQASIESVEYCVAHDQLSPNV